MTTILTLTGSEHGTLMHEAYADGGDLKAAVERIVAARVVEAVDRERAAWATKVADAWDEGFEVGDDFGYGVGKGYPEPADPNPYRGLLAADDTEDKP